MKILVSDPITENGLAVLKNANFDIVELPNGSTEEKTEACKDAHGWIIRSGTTITAAMIETAKNLQVIGRAGVGVDNSVPEDILLKLEELPEILSVQQLHC